MRPTVVILLFTALGYLSCQRQTTTQKERHEKDFTIRLLNDSSLADWTTGSSAPYLGSYHFGNSESEWTLMVLPCDTALVVQVRSAHYNDATNTFVSDYYTFKNVHLVGNLLLADSLKAAFVYQDVGLNHIKDSGLFLFSAPFQYNNDTGRVGEKDENYDLPGESLITQFAGTNAIASLKILPASFFSGRSNNELTIMENEIYARYGLIFKKGTSIEKYFMSFARNNKSCNGDCWYQPTKQNINQYLTDIEKINIETMHKVKPAN